MQDDKLQLSRDLLDIKFPTVEPPKPPPRLTKPQSRAMLLKADIELREETGEGLLVSGPMKAGVERLLLVRNEMASKS